MSDHNLNRLQQYIAKASFAHSADKTAAMNLAASLGGTPSGRAEELIVCLEGEVAKRDARIAELEAQVVRLGRPYVEMRAQLEQEWCQLRSMQDELKTQPSAGVVDDREAFSAEYNKICNNPITVREIAWRMWQAGRLNPCRAQSVPDGYVMVPIGLAHILMAPNARPLTARDARNALRAIVDSAAPSAQQEESDDE